MKSSSRTIHLRLIIGFALILSLNLAGDSVRVWTYRAAEPVHSGLLRFADALVATFGDSAKLREELRRVRNERNELQALLAGGAELREENEELRRALSLGSRISYQTVAGDVLVQDFAQGRMLVRVREGTPPVEGMAVITPEGALVGTVAEVFSEYARIDLAQRDGVSFDVVIADKDIVGVARARSLRPYLLDLVPRGDDLEEGDLVTTSSIGSRFPRGLLVGKVQNIRRTDADPFQQAEIDPSFSVRDAHIVLFVIDQLP